MVPPKNTPGWVISKDWLEAAENEEERLVTCPTKILQSTKILFHTTALQ